MEFYHLSNISPPESHSPIDMNMDTTIDTAIVYLTDKAKQLMNLVELEYFYAAGILVDEALDYYMTLTNKTILLSKDDRSYRDTVISFKACFKLCRIYLKIKDRVIKQKDLIDVLDQIEEARSSPLTSKIFCMVLKRLSQLFLDNDLLVAANSCIQLILDDKMLANNHFSAGVKDLEAQLEYMIRVFLNSIIKLWGDSSASPNEVQMGDELFRDLLYELGVEDHNKMPTIVENPQVTKV